MIKTGLWKHELLVAYVYCSSVFVLVVLRKNALLNQTIRMRGIGENE